MFKSALLISFLICSSSFAGPAPLTLEEADNYECISGAPIDRSSVFNWLGSTCIANWKTTLASNEKLQKLSQESLDLQFCKSCLDKSQNQVIHDAFHAAKEASHDSKYQVSSSDTKQRFQNFRNLAMAKVNGTFFHASILAPDLEKNVDFVSAYNGMRVNSNQSIESFYKDRVQGFLSKHNLSQDITESDFKKVMTISQDEQDKYLGDVGNSCVSFREYLALQQVPLENGFYTSLADMEKFEQKEWNYEGLKAELATLTAGKIVSAKDIYQLPETAERQQMLRLLGRIKFLHANPLYKNLFAQTIGDDDLKEHQAELFNAIKQSFSGMQISACSQEPGACRKMAFNSNAVSELRKNTAAIFQKAHALKFTMDQAAKSYMSMFENMSGEDFKLLRFTDAIRGKCSNPQSDLAECIPAWGGYCQQLDVLKNHINTDKPNASMAMNLLERDLAESFSPENKYFKEYQNANCAGLKEEIAKQCQGTNANPECRTGVRNEFRRNIMLKGGTDSVAINGLLSKAPPKIPSQTFRSRIRDRLSNFVVETDFKDDSGKATAIDLSALGSSSRTASSSANTQQPATRSYSAPESSVNSLGAGSTNLSSGFSTSVSPSPNNMETSIVETTNKYNETKADIDFLKSQLKEANDKLAQATENERLSQAEVVRMLQDKETQLSSEVAKLSKQLADLKSAASQKTTDKKQQIESEVVQQSQGKSQKKNLASSKVEDFQHSESNVLDNSNTGAPANVESASASRNSSISSAGSINANSINSNAINRNIASIPSKTTLNEVLKIKYGITTKGNSEGAFIVNPEADSTKLGLLVKAAGPGQRINVSEEDFLSFANPNQALIKKYESFMNLSSKAVTKISVHNSDKEPLEIFMIREQGKIVIQPVRKVTRQGLIEALTQ